MIIKPLQLGEQGLDRQVMLRDRKDCKRFGPCGVGKQALYLNSFYLACRYYLPLDGITRAYKRVAMSKGGFSGHGVFASIPYLVVEYDNGKEKQCNFKYEEQVDQLLACLKRQCPDIKLVSAEGEARIAKREQEKASRKLPQLSDQALEAVKKLEDAKAYLEKRPDLFLELSQASRRKRAFLRSKPSYRWVAAAVTLLGVAALLYGLWSIVTKSGNFGLYFLLFGMAAIFTFAGARVLPTAKNNRKAVLERAEKAQKAMERYLADRPDFPLPARYGHPIVLQRMIRAIEEGRANSEEQALEEVKRELKSLNSSVEVDREEYDEVVAIKSMFLNEDYR